MPGEIREKCAVAAVGTADPQFDAAPMVYESLFAMQHRGTEASGIGVQHPDLGTLAHRGRGMVIDVFDHDAFSRLQGGTAIGHNRYSTSGGKNGEHPQPFIETSVGLGLTMNGNIPDTSGLSEYLESKGIKTRYLNDTEMAGQVIAHYLRQGNDLPKSVEFSYPLMNGAFSCVAMRDDVLVAFRDPYGIRPFAFGYTPAGDAVLASETCGLDILDAEYFREVAPGEMIVIGDDRKIESRQLAEGQPKLDIFEMVYFARHDSYLYGQRVNEVRRRFGEQLALEHPPITGKSGNELVVPVPDTSIPAAEGYAQALGLEHSQAIIKNRYIGRTFIKPSQEERLGHLRRKHNVISERVEGRDVILIDDSIVRLNTLPKLVQLVNSLGARSVSALIASPPVRFPDFYGIDIPSQKELAAANLTLPQIKERLGNGRGCNYLGYLSLEGMVQATGLDYEKFNLSCFNGEYPIDIGDRHKDIIVPVRW